MSSSDEVGASTPSTGSPSSQILSDIHCDRLSESVKALSCEDNHNGDGGCCECVKLVESVKVLERVLADRDRLITQLREENRRQAAELLEIHLRELQQAISEKDSAIATLEHQLQETTPPLSRRSSGTDGVEMLASLKQLKREKSTLTSQLKVKVKERLALFKKDSEEVIGALAVQHQASTKKQVCNVLRSLERNTERLKAHIDELFALMLEQDPLLMEGLPRIQQEAGLDLDLLADGRAYCEREEDGEFTELC